MSKLPTGTVTFLFTDIEGSTRLLQQLGEGYASVLSECRDLLRAAFRENRGHEIDTQGDSFFVAFARATDAAAAAADAQRALASHSWPEGVALHVRMGLHTGEPSLVAESYVGLDVHYTARIMSAAHGGQVLLSQMTRDLVQYDLPDGVHLRDLGEHRLKDLQRPSRLYQLIIAYLPADFSPLMTLDSRPNNLPVQFTPLIGREQEVAAMQHLLQREHVRLVTLTGPGGTGKTRLGLQVAAELSDLFSHGVYFVNLASLSDPELIVPTIAQTLGIREVAGQSLLEHVQEELHQKQLLLVLDNLEQVVSAAPQLVDLLSACPRLKLLVTSREVLHVRAEREFAVPPLALPDLTHLPELTVLSLYAAVTLFIERAQAVKPDFQVTAANARTIAEICVRLDGLPLALELAAARVKLFPPQALLARLEQRLQVLTSGARDAPVRQQSLRNTLAWSYELLHAEEQRLFRRLSVFVGGCTLQAIEAVCAALDTSNGVGRVLDGVASLIDKSLLRQTEQEGNEPRLMMLETIREYGVEVLTASGEMEAIRRAHAVYYLQLAEEAEPHLRGSESDRWFARLEPEHENQRAALTFLLERAAMRAGSQGEKEWAEQAVRLCGALYWFWLIYGYYREDRSFLEQAMAVREGVATSVQLKLLSAATDLAIWLDEFDRAEALCRESLALSRELGDASNRADALDALGVVAWAMGKYAESHDQLEEAVALFQELGDTWSRARSLAYLARTCAAQGEYDRAGALAEQSLALSRALGNKGRIAIALYHLARVRFLGQDDFNQAQELAEQSLALFRELGDTQYTSVLRSLFGEMRLRQGEQGQARELLEESMETFKELGDRWRTAEALLTLARIHTSQGEFAAARARYLESLALVREIDAKGLIASVLEGGAVVAVQGEPVWAARLWGAAQSLRAVIGAPLPPVYCADYERAVAATRSQLGEKAFATAWAEGRTMTPDQALTAQGPVTLTQPLPTAPSSTPPAKPVTTYPDDLTAREVEVLRLLATGLTDAQIAEQLVLSLHTIHAHLRTIYSKLDRR